jgi:hypothetical protein
LLLQDRIMWLCDPHAEIVVGTGAITVEHVHALCSEDAMTARVA